MGEATQRARQRVVEARRALAGEVDGLGSATRSALDVPEKVRRDPVRTAGLGAGAVFLAVGGPSRILNGMRRRLRRTPPRPRTLLPREIERAVDGLGEDAPEIKARLEREFGKYLDRKRKDPAYEPTASHTIWATADALAKPLSALAARRLAEQFLAPQPDQPTDTTSGERKAE